MPPTNVLTVLYGADGGIACINAGQSEHSNGLWLFGNVHLGRRVVVDPKVIAYDEAVIARPCDRPTHVISRCAGVPACIPPASRVQLSSSFAHTI